MTPSMQNLEIVNPYAPLCVQLHLMGSNLEVFYLKCLYSDFSFTNKCS
jgi:hypothetical protein